MLEQDLEPDQNENDAAGELGAALVARAEHIADVHTAIEITNVVQPMIVMAGTIFTCKKANVTPTASASMLVATARMSSSLKLTPA